jgi:precorrin-8X/cobalt-precorrin-8 methylmutase
MGIILDEENDLVIRRAIHTSADFDYARTLVFSDEAVKTARDLIREGAYIITDTNMALTGINKRRLAVFGGSVCCYMADEEVTAEARERGVTRASVSMEHAAADLKRTGRKAIFAIGNAPTALITLRTMYDEGIFRPDFVIGVPVGFVNVTEAKEQILDTDIPHIINRGRKGGSNVAAAIVNAVLYGMRDRRDE